MRMKAAEGGVMPIERGPGFKARLGDAGFGMADRNETSALDVGRAAVSPSSFGAMS